MMWKVPRDREVLTGNDRFEGFNVDMLKAMAEKANFTYEIKLVNDSLYGAVRAKSQQLLVQIFPLLQKAEFLSAGGRTWFVQQQSGKNLLWRSKSFTCYREVTF